MSAEALVDAYTRIEHFLVAWTVYETSGLVILEAARGVRDHHLSYWDAQIWATARLYQVPVVLSEDFASGSTLEIVQATACWRRSPFCALGMASEGPNQRCSRR